jgi:hypothetical protein
LPLSLKRRPDAVAAVIGSVTVAVVKARESIFAVVGVSRHGWGPLGGVNVENAELAGMPFRVGARAHDNPVGVRQLAVGRLRERRVPSEVGSVALVARTDFLDLTGRVVLGRVLDDERVVTPDVLGLGRHADDDQRHHRDKFHSFLHDLPLFETFEAFDPKMLSNIVTIILHHRMKGNWHGPDSGSREWENLVFIQAQSHIPSSGMWL